MAGDNQSIDSFSNRILWQFITGTGVLRPKEIIDHELNKNKSRLLNGLLHYRSASGTPGEALKKERKVSGLQLEFTLKLSKFLGVDEVLCHDLLCAFLVNDYRGSKKSLKHVLSHERHSQALILKIRDFYYTDRLYLLRCLRHIIIYWDTQHPYREVYSNFLKSLQVDPQHSLQEQLLKQLKTICELQPPSVEKNGIIMTEAQILAWVSQNLKEQCELLELALLLFKDCEMETRSLKSYLDLFKSHGFGYHQNYKHLLDDATQKYIHWISYLEVLIVLEAMDFDRVLLYSHNNKFSVPLLFKKEENFQDLNAVMCKLGSEPIHGPILLGWSMVRHFYLSGGEEHNDMIDADTHKLGNTALQLGVFKVLLDILSAEPFSRSNFLAALVHFIVYKLMDAVLSTFHEDTLGSQTTIYEICGRLLRQPAVAEEVWQKGDGLWLLYDSTLRYFPFEFSRFMNLTVALAAASKSSALQVKDLLLDLQSYTEYLDNNRDHDLMATRDPNVFCLTTDKKVYSNGDLIICKGCRGQVLEASAIPRCVVSQLSGPLIRWQVHYNGWQLLYCEIQELLKQITHGAGMVQPAQVQRVTLVMELLQSVLKADPNISDEFGPFVSLCYQIIHRFSVLSQTPLDLLSRTVGCLAAAAQLNPKEVWHHLKQTGLLPYLTENVDSLGEVLSGRGLHPGKLGSIMAVTECTQGRYHLTLAVLSLVVELVQPFSRGYIEEELQACILHILREVFPLFHKWRYMDISQRRQIGQQCLTLFHKVLNLTELQKKISLDVLKPKRPSLHEVCMYSLLFTESGRALMEIVATGTDSVEFALVQQGSMTEGGGVDLIELIQLSLSLLNRLLLLRSPELPTSPVEQALSWQPAGRQSQHVVTTVAQYIYHRHNPRLPTLATLLLKRLAMMTPMSILACLGNDAEPIRDVYLARLQALSEDLRLKVAILELLSVCVETQPGLIEIFFDVQIGSADKTEGKKDLQLGRSSCLQTLLTLLDVQKQTTYMCPPDLLRAGLDLVHSLWRGRRETAMEVLRSKHSFWGSVTAPLRRDITELKEETEIQLQPTEVKIAAFSLKILAQEIFALNGVSLDPQLKTCLQDIGKDNRMLYWSQFVKRSLLSEGAKQEKAERDYIDNPTVLLLKAWRNFLIVISRFKLGEELLMTDKRKEEIMSHLLEGVQALFAGELSLLKMKLASLVSALYYTLLKAWVGCISKPVAVLVAVRNTLEQTRTGTEMVIPSVQIGLVASLNLLLQRGRTDSSSVVAPPTVATLLRVVGPMLLQSTRELPHPSQLAQSIAVCTEPKFDLKTLGTAEAKVMLQITICSLMTEIVMATDPQFCLTYLQEHSVLAALLVSVESYIKAKQGLSYVHCVLLLFAAIGESERGATILALSDFTSHTCLAITHLYSKEDIFATQMLASNVPGSVTSSTVTWHDLYCLSIALYTLMLRKLGFSFLEDALNFLGVHQDRLQRSLEISCLTLLDPAMKEAESTCHFLHQMALYRRQWRLHLPHVMSKLLTSTLRMVQTFISLIIRPRYLQHILERGREIGPKGKHSLQSSPLLQHQTSTDDVEQPSEQLLHTENSMLRIIGKSLAMLRYFSPDLCEVLLDQGMDMSEYERLVDMGFSTPPVDQESPLTFGSLISCVTACLRRLSKIDPRTHSPHRMPSPQRKSPKVVVPSESQVSRNVLFFVMETCLTLTLTQACRYLCEPSLSQRDKQFLKRELSTELNSFLTSLLRHVRRGAPSSPGDKSLTASPHAGSVTSVGSPSTSTGTITPSTPAGSSRHSLHSALSQTNLLINHDQRFFKMVQDFVKKVLR